MSTNSRIFLKLKEEDKGKIKKAEKTLIDINECNHETPSVKLDGDYISIYCHWDGYVEGVGKALLKYHNTYDHILNMLLFGDLSYVEKSIKAYYAWRGNRIERWDIVQPKLTNNTELYESYNYLFDYETNKWYVSKGKENNFKELVKEC